MKIVETKVFLFGELSDSAKEKAREWYREGGLSYEWYDSVVDDAYAEREWDYMNADEQVDESIIVNEYTFTVDGRRFG